MAGKNPFRTALIAPCGMDCAICSAFLRQKNRCGGCDTANHSFRRRCTIATCEHMKRRYVHDCGNFPCRRLKQLDKRYCTKYHMSMPDNLAAIRKDGIRAFVRSERECWTCTACRGNNRYPPVSVFGMREGAGAAGKNPLPRDHLKG